MTDRFTFSLGSGDDCEKRREALERLAKEEGVSPGMFMRNLLDREIKKAEAK